MKNYKKIIFGVLVAVTIIPKIALASWWNPSDVIRYIVDILLVDSKKVNENNVDVSVKENLDTDDDDKKSFDFLNKQNIQNSENKVSNMPTIVDGKVQVDTVNAIKATKNSNNPLITDVIDQDSAQARNQFVSGNKIMIGGSRFGDGNYYYKGKVYFDAKTVNFEDGATNAIVVKSPILTTGEHTVYIVGSDGRKSNKFKVFVVSRDATSPTLPSVTVKVNGSQSLSSVPYNSPITVSWSSINTTDCAAYGHNMPRKEGGIWTEQRNLPRSGSDELYARGNNGVYYPTMTIGVHCSTGDLKGINSFMDIKVTPPDESNPLITQAAQSMYSNLKKTILTGIYSKTSNQGSGQFFHGDLIMIKGDNLKSTSPNHVWVDNIEVIQSGGETTDDGVAKAIGFIIPITVSAGKHNVYVVNEGGTSNSLKMEVIDLGLADRPISVAEIVNKTTGLSDKIFNVGDSITLWGKDIPYMGSINIEKNGQQDKISMGFFVEFDQSVGRQKINFKVPYLTAGQYSMQILGADGRKSEFISITISSLNQG